MTKETFYPMTAETLEKLISANLTAAEWRLWSYLVITDPWGDNYKDLPDTLTVMEKVDIKKSTFYAAIAKFQKFELFDFQDKGFAIRNLRGVPKVRNTVRDSGNDSEISENFPKSRKTFRENGTLSEISENETSEPLHSKKFQTPQTYSDLKEFKDTTETEGSVKNEFENQFQEVFDKYKDKLALYTIRSKCYVNDELADNPKLEKIKKAIAHIPITKIETGIRAFLAWIKDAKNVRDPYKALHEAILRGWEI